MTPKKILLPLLILGTLAATFFFSRSPQADKAQKHKIKTTVTKGEFVIKVTATGELKAKRSEKIRGPQGMRSARIYQTNITDMVPEGTKVKAGDYVATLDRTELDNKLKEAQSEIDKIETQLEQARIDTAIEMRGLRDQLINYRFAMKEKQLEVEQSKYEAPMVIQRANIELERAQRDYDQLLAKYQLTEEKSVARISEILASLRQQELKRKRLKDLSNSFRIVAPKDGMVIYARSWQGKVGPGSQISTWNPVVAELPDLSDMVSKTFINEVDISRVKKGQEVTIKVDAFPENTYTGKVIKVANIGEQLKNYDSKVFEVVIQVNETDSILRPAMTTSNEIVTDVFEEVLSIPIEALFSDSLSYVFVDKGGKIIKQEVIPGLSNDQAVIIAHGLESGAEILLISPDNADKLDIVTLDPKIKQDIQRRLEDEKKARDKAMKEKMEAVKNEKISDDNLGGGGV
ncbi:MAG TPA: HlyD family efflux transporter periplasmic adaptor subunit, partial [Phaeodactylibacter sp.]|nr:HlyD family efflux transporter periplasmic adaptor subunit [Phaeodactylibacter sp.]